MKPEFNGSQIEVKSEWILKVAKKAKAAFKVDTQKAKEEHDTAIALWKEALVQWEAVKAANTEMEEYCIGHLLEKNTNLNWFNKILCTVFGAWPIKETPQYSTREKTDWDKVHNDLKKDYPEWWEAFSLYDLFRDSLRSYYDRPDRPLIYYFKKRHHRVKPCGNYPHEAHYLNNWWNLEPSLTVYIEVDEYNKVKAWENRGD